jgi:hypothetical protein
VEISAWLILVILSAYFSVELPFVGMHKEKGHEDS